MSQNDVQEFGETEIIVETPLRGSDQTNDAEETISDVKITKKAVKDLTKQERDIIIANAEKGIDNEYFDVKYYKNGSKRIVAKKPKAPTVTQKVIKNNNDGKVYLSNDQLLMEHIIELNARLDKLTGKHKKLKKKYRRMRNDIYEDVDEPHEVPHETPHEVPQEVPQEVQTLPRTTARGWRSRVTFL